MFIHYIASAAAVLLNFGILYQDKPQKKESDVPITSLPANRDLISPPNEDDARKAIQRGITFLIKDQNTDGSWGGPRNKMNTDSFANVATHHAWTVATTGLVCSSIVELTDSPEALAACDRGLDYICENAILKRPDDWDNDNVWGQIYGLQGIAKCLAHPRYKDPAKATKLKKAAAEFLNGLKKFRSPRGGWGYYADADAAWRPEWATSFTTAAGVIALCDAKDVGIPVDADLIEKAVMAVENSRLPNGAYTYSVEAIPDPSRLEGIDTTKGSLGRIQVCNLALLRGGRKVTTEQLKKGLNEFFEHHKFLDVGRMKPIPHEAYYAVAGYFYFFGHYYASRVLTALPEKERAAYIGDLRKHIIKTIEGDGSMWDFYISSHTRAYGTSFGIMTLGATLIKG
ncbi:MAG: hypothetical protein ACKVS6_07280 [Planctomycetota bacterium]